MKLLWSNTDDNSIVEWVKDNVNNLKFEQWEGKGSICEDENHKEYALMTNIQEIEGEFVDDFLKTEYHSEVHALHIGYCSKCGVYTIDIAD